MLVIEEYVQDGMMAKEKFAAIETPCQKPKPANFKVSSALTDEKRPLDTAKEHHNEMLELADLLDQPSTQRDGSS